MFSLSHIDILRMFLIHHRAYNAYLSNHNNTAHYYYDYPGARVDHMILLCGFGWDDSPQGAAYWANLNRKWEQLCDHFHLTGVRFTHG